MLIGQKPGGHPVICSWVKGEWFFARIFSSWLFFHKPHHSILDSFFSLHFAVLLIKSLKATLADTDYGRMMVTSQMFYGQYHTWGIHKVIIEKPRGGRFLWIRNWDLGWIWAGSATIEAGFFIFSWAKKHSFYIVVSVLKSWKMWKQDFFSATFL